MKSILYPNWQEKVVFGTDGPQPEILVENEKMKVILAGLKPGPKIPVHPESLATYYILEGTGTMVVDDERTITTGAIVVTPEGSARGIEADTQLVFKAVRVS